VKSKKRNPHGNKDFIDKTPFTKPFVTDYCKLIDHVIISAKLGIERIRKEVGILKVEQARQINDEPCDQKSFIPFGSVQPTNATTYQIIEQQHKAKQQHKVSRSFEIKEETHACQEDAAE